MTVLKDKLRCFVNYIPVQPYTMGAMLLGSPVFAFFI